MLASSGSSHDRLTRSADGTAASPVGVAGGVGSESGSTTGGGVTSLSLGRACCCTGAAGVVALTVAEDGLAPSRLRALTA